MLIIKGVNVMRVQSWTYLIYVAEIAVRELLHISTVGFLHVYLPATQTWSQVYSSLSKDSCRSVAAPVYLSTLGFLNVSMQSLNIGPKFTAALAEIAARDLLHLSSNHTTVEIFACIYQ